MNPAAKELTGWQEGSVLYNCCRQIDLNHTASGNIEFKRQDSARFNQPLIKSNLEPALNHAHEILGCSADMDRIYIFENYDTEECEHRWKLSYDWFQRELPI
jgi:hypothetical protein